MIRVLWQNGRVDEYTLKQYRKIKEDSKLSGLVAHTEKVKKPPYIPKHAT